MDRGAPREPALNEDRRFVRAGLAVRGMHCSSCSAVIEETLTSNPAVESAAVDLEGARAEVVYDPTALELEDLCAVVAGLGYAASPLPDVARHPDSLR
jgi:Cu+-exporting ATPase